MLRDDKTGMLTIYIHVVELGGGWGGGGRVNEHSDSKETNHLLGYNLIKLWT